MTSTQLRTPQPQNARTILFVDDEPITCKWFYRSFSDEFTIVTATGTESALQVLSNFNTHIAVLVTDFRMPGQDGLALLRSVQAEHRHVVRILFTAYAEKEMALTAVNQGRVHRILEKPLDEALVREALRDALDTYRQRKREREHFLIEGRTAAKGETLGFLAKKLNTPLTTVLDYVKTLRERYLAPASDLPAGVAQFTEKRSGDIVNMIDAVERRTQYAMLLGATIEESARTAYPGAASASFQASQLVNALLNEYPFEGNERAWITYDLDADFLLPQQPDLLYLVLCILTKNAMSALRERPEPNLHISLARNDSEEVQTDDGETQCEILFTDNGKGIDPESLARLMRDPVTPDWAPARSETGLIFCQRVVQSMQGLIEVQSKPGQGTTVRLVFNTEPNLERVKP